MQIALKIALPLISIKTIIQDLVYSVIFNNVKNAKIVH